MKKIILLVILLLCFMLIFLASLLLTNKEADMPIKYNDYSESILSSSSWVDLDSSDFNSLILGSYSINMSNIINSLEEAIPVIVEVYGGQFSNSNRNNFIVVSRFDENGNVNIYVPNGNGEYDKKVSSLEEVFENAVRFFITNNKEATA